MLGRHVPLLPVGNRSCFPYVTQDTVPCHGAPWTDIYGSIFRFFRNTDDGVADPKWYFAPGTISIFEPPPDDQIFQRQPPLSALSLVLVWSNQAFSKSVRGVWYLMSPTCAALLLWYVLLLFLSKP